MIISIETAKANVYQARDELTHLRNMIYCRGAIKGDLKRVEKAELKFDTALDNLVTMVTVS